MISPIRCWAAMRKRGLIQQLQRPIAYKDFLESYNNCKYFVYDVEDLYVLIVEDLLNNPCT